MEQINKQLDEKKLQSKSFTKNIKQDSENEDDNSFSSSESDEDDQTDDIDLLKIKSNRPRTSVMGDSGKPDPNFIARIIPKSDDIKKRIKAKLESSFMFSNLDEKEKETVISAMEEKDFSKEENIITQGDSGNELFILDSGTADCYKSSQDNKEPK